MRENLTVLPPKRLDDLTGQETAVKMIRDSVAGGHPAQAYILAGPRGTGKASAARILAAALNRPKGYEGGETTELDAGKKRLSGSLSQIQPPQRAKVFNVAIILNADRTRKEDIPALAEFLDNPPARTIPILTATNPGAIPVSASPILTIPFLPTTPEKIAERLEREAAARAVLIDKESALTIARTSGGSTGDAIVLLNRAIMDIGQVIRKEDTAEMETNVSPDLKIKLTEAILASNTSRAMAIIKEAETKGQTTSKVLEALATHIRSLKESKTSGRIPPTIPARLGKAYTEQESRIGDKMDAVIALITGHLKSEDPQGIVKESETYRIIEAIISAVREKPVNKTNQPYKTEEREKERARTVRQLAASRGNTNPLSLRNIIINEENQEAKPRLSNIQPDEETTARAWQSIKDSLRERGSLRVAAALENAPTRFIKGNGTTTVSFMLANTATLEWIRTNMMTYLTRELAERTGSSRVMINADVARYPIRNRYPYTNREKAETLMRQNEQLRILVEELGLEAD